MDSISRWWTIERAPTPPTSGSRVLFYCFWIWGLRGFETLPPEWSSRWVIALMALRPTPYSTLGNKDISYILQARFVSKFLKYFLKVFTGSRSIALPTLGLLVSVDWCSIGLWGVSIIQVLSILVVGRALNVSGDQFPDGEYFWPGQHWQP
jgi:hypothetical protein